jgi:hypothetical protein
MSSAVEKLIHTVEPRCGELFELPEMDAPYVLMVGVFDSDSWSTRCVEGRRPFLRWRQSGARDYFDGAIHICRCLKN